jgi:hypothetical protein
LGDGYATIKVQPTGKLQLKGTLADGTKISQSTTAGGEGQWPFYVPLYKGQGQILGWLTFENRADRDVGGLVSWIKPADDAKFYPDGFNFETVASGSTYNPSLDPVSGFDFATVKLLGGNLPFDLFESVLINTNNKVSSFGPDKTTLSLNPSQGLFKVTVVNTNIHTTVKGNGVILQKQIIGSGFFLGTNQSGRVTIEPAL